MSHDVIRREPLADPLLAQLRAVLDEVEAQPDGWPSTMPPWEDLGAAMRASRRQRRLHRTRRLLGRTLGTAAAVALAGLLVMTGVVPYPSFAPAITAPSSAGHSALYGQPTLGTLGSNEEWLAAFRAWVADKRSSPDGDGTGWKPPRPDRLKVLLAGDYGGQRVALVEGDWRQGAFSYPQQVWFTGPSGAAADQLTERAIGDPVDVPVQVFQPDPEQAKVGRATSALLVTPSMEVTLQGTPTIDARARVVQNIVKLAPADFGIYDVTVSSEGSFQLLVSGKPVGPAFEGVAGGPGGTSATSPEPGPLTPARGGAVVTGDTGFDDQIREAARQPHGRGTFSMLVGASSTAGQQILVHPYVGMVTLPSGARVLGMGGSFTDPKDGVAVNEFDSASLAPGGRTAELAVAWRSIPAEFHDRPTFTAAMGPVGTTTVEWVRADGAATSSPATDTLAVTVRDDVRSVRFLDVAGKVLATEPVLAPLEVGTPIPQVAVATSAK